MSDLSARQFADPAMEFRPAPLWAWNGEMTPELIRRQLREMKDGGFGGALVNPRPGLVNPYLSEEWFSLWSVALEEAERLGLKLSIYDENSYPSGFAGGHVPSELPDCLAQAVLMRELTYEELPVYLPIASGMLNRPGHPIRVFAIVGKSSGPTEEVDIVRDVTDLPFASWLDYGPAFLLFEIGMPETNPWLGGFAYTDLLRPEVTESFLRHTYEAYRERFEDRFGSVIPAIFTDEPEISPGNLFRQAGADFLPFSYWFAGQFEARNGYDLKDYLPCLFRDIRAGSLDRDPRQVRYDYYDTIHDLWVNNFAQPISSWCENHGIAWTGHYVEHNWPYPWGRSSPAIMSLYEYMQWPGIDLLRSNSLRQPGHEGTEMLMLAVREASSAANQFDRERVLCEAYGAGGWDSDFKDYKRIGDWLFAHGINYLTPHLVLASLAGARKRDHPQSFDWRQAWWQEYGTLNDYFARLSYVLSQGETRNRVLLLNPCLSAYLETSGSQHGELRVNEPPRHPDMGNFLRIAQQLCDLGWNYDLGDEYIVERHGRLSGKRLVVNKREYDVVIYPDSMDTMKASTFEWLEGFLQAGGVVLALGEPGSRIDGRTDARTGRLAEYEGWRVTDNIGRIDEELAVTVSRQWKWLSPDSVPAGVHHLRRDLSDGSSVYFFVNSGLQTVTSTLAIDGARAEIWDPWTGNVTVPEYRVRSGQLLLELELAKEGSVLIRVYAGKVPQAGVEIHPSTKEVEETPIAFEGQMRVTVEKDNWLVLDYCDLEVGNKLREGISTLHAQKLVYEHHGFEANPWDNAVQFKRRLIDRNRFPEDSGFTVRYRFRLSHGWRPEKLKLWVERATYYRLKVNGQEAVWSDERSELDEDLGCAEIGAFLMEGENVIELRAQPFDLLLELEPVYLTGHFAVRGVDGAWMIGKPDQLAVGSWREQGYPFYGYAVGYERTAIVEDTNRRYAVRLPDSAWAGTAASLFVNGQPAGLFGVGRGQEVEITSYLRKGDNRIAVRLCGSFKNLLGPFHDPARTRKTAWPAFWKTSPVQGPPAPDEYDLLNYGLFAQFEVVVRPR